MKQKKSCFNCKFSLHNASKSFTRCANAYKVFVCENHEYNSTGKSYNFDKKK